MGEIKEPRIVGKIDLEKFQEKPRINFEKISVFLKEGLKKISSEVNNEHQGFGEIIEDDATIKILGPDRDLHEKVVREKEAAWASSMSCSVSEWKKKKEKDPATLAENFITILLHEELKDQFLVAKSSHYDDYENGVDYVLMDKKTGAVVCGLDQVLGRGKDDGASKKKDKIEKIIARGGARLEYGLTLDNNNKISRKKLSNIPAFFLALSKDDLDKALLSLQKNNDLKNFNIDEIKANKDFSDFSQKILKKMIASLEEQFDSSSSLIESVNGNRYKKLLENIDRFKDSLEVIKNKIDQ
jgi:hypothetical protein